MGAREDRTSVKVLCLLLMRVYAVLHQRCNPRYLFDYMHLSVAQSTRAKRVKQVNLAIAVDSLQIATMARA